MSRQNVSPLTALTWCSGTGTDTNVNAVCFFVCCLFNIMPESQCPARAPDVRIVPLGTVGTVGTVGTDGSLATAYKSLSIILFTLDNPISYELTVFPRVFTRASWWKNEKVLIVTFVKVILYYHPMLTISYSEKSLSHVQSIHGGLKTYYVNLNETFFKISAFAENHD